MRVSIVGDSHTSFLCGSNYQTESELAFKDYTYGFYFLGPQLAYSFSDLVLEKLDTNVQKKIKSSDINIHYLGEIDVRCHLTVHQNPEICAEMYFQRARDISLDPYFIEPVRQSAIVSSDVKFPQRGTLAERIEKHNRFTQKLLQLAGIGNFISQIAGSQGFLTLEDTEDGCHLSKSRNSELLTKIVKFIGEVQTSRK